MRDSGGDGERLKNAETAEKVFLTPAACSQQTAGSPRELIVC